MKQNIIRLILLFLIGIMTVNTVNAGFNVVVTPVENIVSPGGTARFSVEVVAIDTLDTVEIIDLTVTDMDENPISWTTTFSPDLFPIGPYADPFQRTKTSTLEIVVPNPFTQKVNLLVKGEGFYETIPGVPDNTFVAEFAIFPISIAPVPELSTTILTSAGLLGIVLISRKYRGKT
jgi:hypothetical protein